MFLPEGVHFFLLLFYESREDPNTTKSGLSLARQRNAIANERRFAGGPGRTQPCKLAR